jgi:hypothetical protein
VHRVRGGLEPDLSFLASEHAAPAEWCDADHADGRRVVVGDAEYAGLGPGGRKRVGAVAAKAEQSRPDADVVTDAAPRAVHRRVTEPRSRR